MEYPDDEKSVSVDHQFMFGEELLVAPVVRKGERVKQVYLPEGEWIDFNNNITVYTGGEVVKYTAPLSVVPIFVKKGSIIPMMPVMQYIHEVKDYPLHIHIYPNYEDEVASFELYEDDGVNQDYLKNIYSKTKFVCTTNADGYNIVVTPQDKGFNQADKREMVLSILVDSKPKSVMLNGQLHEFDWDENTNKCVVKIIDTRTVKTVSIKNKE